MHEKKRLDMIIHIIVLLCVSFASISCETCFNDVKTFCSTQDDCPDGFTCMGRDCCARDGIPEIVCTATGMRSQEKKLQRFIKEGKAYIDPKTQKACPVPINYNTHRVLGAPPLLPIGYEGPSTRWVPRCTKNSECGKGAFCGSVLNPAYWGNMDQTNERASIRFCYKLPQKAIDEGGIKPSKKFLGLIFCNTNADCGDQGSCIDLEAVNDDKYQLYRGICVVTEADVQRNPELGKEEEEPKEGLPDWSDEENVAGNSTMTPSDESNGEFPWLYVYIAGGVGGGLILLILLIGIICACKKRGKGKGKGKKGKTGMTTGVSTAGISTWKTTVG